MCVMVPSGQVAPAYRQYDPSNAGTNLPDYIVS